MTETLRGSLDGKAAIVTGASQEIGAAMAGDTLKLEKVTPRGSARYGHRLEGKNSYHFTIENSLDQGKSWQTFLTAAYRRK